MVNGIILKKFQTLDDVLAELRSLEGVTVDELHENWLKRRAIERDLQVLVEIVIDVCQRIISLASQTPTDTGAQAIQRCVALGALASADTYKEMVQFRNFVVHRYESVDIAILVDVINRHLDDFEKFQREVLEYAQRTS